MKKVLAITALFLTLAGIFASAKDKKEEQVRIAAAIEALDFNIDINTILSQGGETIHDSGTYFLKMKDGNVKSYLPFIGESYGGVIGGSDQSISFDGPADVKIEKSKKKGQYILTFKGSAPSGKWDVTIEVWTSGSATITCSNPSKSLMTYWGEMDIPSL